MEIRGVSEAALRRAAGTVSATCENWRATRHGFAFVLRPERGSDRYRGLGHDGSRRVNAICFHGHKKFMDAVFKVSPEAVIITAMARYDGQEDFERKWRTLDTRRGFQSTFNCSHGG